MTKEDLAIQLATAHEYADSVARDRLEHFCRWHPGRWLELHMAGPIVGPDLAYMRSRGYVETHPKKKHWFRLRDEPIA